MLFAYRRNYFGQRKRCLCRKPYLYTYKICSYLPYPVRLSRAEREEKATMFTHLDPADSKVTDLDYLLNKGRLEEATKVLTAISIKLGELYRQEKLALVESGLDSK